MTKWSFFRTALKALHSEPVIGGLAINEGMVQFARVFKDEVAVVSLRIPPGVVEEGKVKDEEALVSVLKNLHRQIPGYTTQRIGAVLNIPERHVYTQMVTLPLVSSANLDEAVRLNLQMISPIAYADAYADWQKIGESDMAGGQIDILAAFAPKFVIDGFVRAATDASFTIAAVEFPGLAMARLLASRGDDDALDSAILFRVVGAGLSFTVVRKGMLAFNRFVPWSRETMPFLHLQEVLIRETQKVLNFSAGRWQERPRALFLFLPQTSLKEKIVRAFETHFTIPVSRAEDSLSPRVKQFKMSMPIEDIAAALGSALRGLVPRSKDTMVSLASVGTEEEFTREQVTHFVQGWRNVMAATAIFLIVVFGAADALIWRLDRSLTAGQANALASNERQKLNELQARAAEVNGIVKMALDARQRSFAWAPLLGDIAAAANTSVFIDRIFIQSVEAPVALTARAANENVMLAFKNALAGEPSLYEISLPLENITRAGGDAVRFTMSFRVR